MQIWGLEDGSTVTFTDIYIEGDNMIWTTKKQDLIKALDEMSWTVKVYHLDNWRNAALSEQIGRLRSLVDHLPDDLPDDKEG